MESLKKLYQDISFDINNRMCNEAKLYANFQSHVDYIPLDSEIAKPYEPLEYLKFDSGICSEKTSAFCSTKDLTPPDILG